VEELLQGVTEEGLLEDSCYQRRLRGRPKKGELPLSSPPKPISFFSFLLNSPRGHSLVARLPSPIPQKQYKLAPLPTPFPPSVPYFVNPADGSVLFLSNPTSTNANDNNNNTSGSAGVSVVHFPSYQLGATPTTTTAYPYHHCFPPSLPPSPLFTQQQLNQLTTQLQQVCYLISFFLLPSFLCPLSFLQYFFSLSIFNYWFRCTFTLLRLLPLIALPESKIPFWSSWLVVFPFVLTEPHILT
jgi:hypothetical protein